MSLEPLTVFSLLVNAVLFFGIAFLLWKYQPKPNNSNQQNQGYNELEAVEQDCKKRIEAAKESYRYLLYNVTHDGSNALQTLLLTLENMSGCSIENEARWRQQQRLIRADVEHLVHLVEEAKILALVDNEQVPVTRQRVNIGKLIEWVILALAEKAEKREVNLAYRGLSHPPFVMGDKNRLRQVLTNLVDNAIKYMPEEKEGEVTITVSANKTHLTIEISDNGAGMREEQLAMIWDTPFQPRDALKKKEKSMGFGLAIVKRSVAQHGGTVKVSSVLGEGSIFTITLPLP